MDLLSFRSDIILVLQKSRVSKDSRINERHIQFLIDKYRAVGIRQDYKRNETIDPAWILDTGVIQFSAVNSGEDLPISTRTVVLGKYTLPSSVVALPDHLGLIRVSSSSRRTTYHYTSAANFFSIPEDSDFKNNNYCFQIGDALYTHPNAEWGNIQFIPASPLLVPVLQTDKPVLLIIGQNYIVNDGNIMHAGTTYYTGQVFTATEEDYTGEGDLRAVNKTRPRTVNDYYPMDMTLSEFVSMKIFSNEFSLEPKEVADIKNDNADQLSNNQANK